MRMKHVLADNGVLNMGGGVVFQIPLWYDDLAKTGLVPRWVCLGVCALATTDYLILGCPPPFRASSSAAGVSYECQW